MTRWPSVTVIVPVGAFEELDRESLMKKLEKKCTLSIKRSQTNRLENKKSDTNQQ